jgi:hypothetical protein
MLKSLCVGENRRVASKLERLEPRVCLSMAYGVDDVSPVVDLAGWSPQLLLGESNSLGRRGADDGSVVLDMVGPGQGSSGLGRGRVQESRLAIEVLRFADGTPLTGTAQSLADGSVGVMSQLGLADGDRRGTRALYVIPRDRPQPERVYLFDASPPVWGISGAFRASSDAATGRVRYNITISDPETYLDAAQVSGLSLRGPTGQIAVSMVGEHRAPGSFHSVQVYTIELTLPLDQAGRVRSGSYVLSGRISASDIAGNVLEETVEAGVSTFAGGTWSQPAPPDNAPIPGITVETLRSAGGAVYLSRLGDRVLVNEWGLRGTGEYRTGWMSVPLATDTPQVLTTPLLEGETIERVQWFTTGGGALVTGSRGTRFTLGDDGVSVGGVTLPDGIGTNFEVMASDDGSLLIAASDGNGITFPQLAELRRLWIAPRGGVFSEVALGDDPTARRNDATTPGEEYRGILAREFPHDAAQGAAVPQGFNVDGGAASIAEALVGLTSRRQARVFPASEPGTYHVYLRSNDGLKHAELRVDDGEFQVSRPTLVVTTNTVAMPSKTSVKTLSKAFWLAWMADGTVLSTLTSFSGGALGTKMFRIKPLGTRPVLFVPGIVGSWPKRGEYNRWLMELGVKPSSLELDPLARTYTDLVRSLEGHGYVEGKDLFLVPYDWRVPWAPSDGAADGRITGLTADSLVDARYEYGVDYLGAAMSQAVESWTRAHGYPLDAVDVIAHSMGGLVTRSYIQSDAYGAMTGTGARLPVVNEFVAMATPHQGASKAWNLMNSNFIADPVYQIVFSGIVFDAYNRLFTKPVRYPWITTPGGARITAELIRERSRLPQYAQLTTSRALDGTPPGEPQMALIAAFMDLYVPGGGALTAIYDFIFADGFPGNWSEATAPDAGGALVFRNLNGDAARRNSVLLDLNGGRSIRFDPASGEWDLFDSYDETSNRWRYMVGTQVSTADMNAFAGLARSTIIASVDMPTMSVSRAVVGPRRRDGTRPPVGSSEALARPIQPVDNRDRQPIEDELWFMDVHPLTPASEAVLFPESGYLALQRSLSLGNLSMPLGDATVPGTSSVNPFVQDDRLARFYLQQQEDHGTIMANADAQAVALRMIGASVDRQRISTGSQTLSWRTIQEVITILMDPVEAVVTDELGRRVGWTAATGAVADIPGSMYFGDSEGIGFIFNDSGAPAVLSVNMKSLDGSPLVKVSTFRAGAEAETIVLDDPLPIGQSRVVALTPQGSPGRPGIAAAATLPNGLRGKTLTLAFEQLLAATNATDPDGTSVQLRIDSVISGVLKRNGGAVQPGVTTLAPGDSLDWTPTPKATGTVGAFSLSAVSDGEVSPTTCTVRVILRTSNRKPVIQKVATPVVADSTAPFSFDLPTLLARATDPDGDPLTFFLTAGPKTGTLTRNGQPVPKGAIRLQPTDTLTFTSTATQKNNVSVFTFVAGDGVSRSGPSTISLRVNVAPTLRVPRDFAAPAGGTPFVVTHTALARALGAIDANKDLISFRIESVGLGLLSLGGVEVIPGQTLLGPGASLIWTPPTTPAGRVVAFTVRATDGRLFSAAATIWVRYSE